MVTYVRMYMYLNLYIQTGFTFQHISNKTQQNFNKARLDGSSMPSRDEM